MVHIHHEPRGEWWQKTLEIPGVNINTIDLPTHVGNKVIKKTAHRADVARMQFLIEHGGVYMDIDTISHRPYNHLLDNDVLLAREHPDGICNAVMMTCARSEFFNIWWSNYEKFFNPDGWREASIVLPELIHKKTKNLARVVSPDLFFMPNWNQTEKIFTGDNQIPDQLVTLHLWEKFSIPYLKQIPNWDWLKIPVNKNTMYGRLLSHVQDIYI